MDASKCQAVLVASETGSFSAAAEQLNYTQSGITRMISSLEEELDFPIFIRNKKGVRLTENGQLMLPYFREIVDANQVAVEVSEEIKGLVRGSITIGCYFSVSSMWMPSLLKAFSETYPSIQITLLEGGNKEITKWLPKNHPKAKQKTYKIKDLETEDFIHTLPGQDTDQDRLIKQEGLTLQTRFTTKDGFTTYQMVKDGLGVSFNQAMIARDWKEEVAQVPLSPKRFVSLGMALPKKEKVSPVVQRFMDCLEQWMVEFLE